MFNFNAVKIEIKFEFQKNNFIFEIKLFTLKLRTQNCLIKIFHQIISIF